MGDSPPQLTSHAPSAFRCSAGSRQLGSLPKDTATLEGFLPEYQILPSPVPSAREKPFIADLSSLCWRSGPSGSQPRASTGAPRNIKAQRSLRVSILFANSSKCPTLPSASRTAAQHPPQAPERRLCPGRSCQLTRSPTQPPALLRAGPLGCSGAPFLQNTLDQIFGMPEAGSGGENRLAPGHTAPIPHCRELDGRAGWQMPEGKQWHRATRSTTSPHSPEKPGEPQSCLQAAASPTQAPGHRHGALAPAHSRGLGNTRRAQTWQAPGWLEAMNRFLPPARCRPGACHVRCD